MTSVAKQFALAGVVGLAALSSNMATSEAATPAPTRTPAVTATPTPRPIAAEYSGAVWVDAKPSFGKVQAVIGGQVCAESSPLMIPDGYDTTYDLRVPSDEEVVGCGKPGDTVSFFVDGRQANETGVWNPASDPYNHLTLIVGPPFAQIDGNAVIGQLSGLEEVVPYVGGNACGYQINPWLGIGPEFGYHVVVYSEELQPGCGVEGAGVSFKLLDEQGDVIAVAPQKGVWHAWDGGGPIMMLDITLERGGIGMPGVGEGSEHESSTAPLAVLAAVGVIVFALGGTIGLRRRHG